MKRVLPASSWRSARLAGLGGLLASLFLGAVRAMTPEPAALAPKAVAAVDERTQHPGFNPGDFDKCVGFFQYADYRFYQFADFPVVARVYREGSRLYVQDTGQEPIELVPDRSDERAARADWDAVAAKLQQRMASTKPSPGTEAALRGQVEGWVKNRPDYLPVPYVLAGTRLEPEPPEHFRKTLDELGTFTELRFMKVSQTGWDIFEARFSGGTLEIAVAPLSPSGKFAGESYRLQ